MKFVKCDKCGLTAGICLVDSDYLCDGENSYIIREHYVSGEYFDLCDDCITSLLKQKELIEKNFVKDLRFKKE